MGAIEDFRKLLQDFLAPELHAIKEQLKALETGQQELKADFKAAQQELKAEFKDLRAEITRQFEKAEVHADTRYHELATSLHLEERVKRIEDRQPEAE